MHLNPIIEPDLEQITRVSVKDMLSSCDHFHQKFPLTSTERGVMVVLNSNILEEKNAQEAFQHIVTKEDFIISYSPDFRLTHAFKQLEQAHSLGIRFLKYHPYFQKIESSDFHKCAALARHAESLGMLLMVCCSHGTRALYHYSGVRLAAFLSEQVSCPIVMSHAGGIQILDAMLVALDSKNLFLDTSFSLPYYIGSSIEMDFAFAMKKLGSQRWVYGSDAPFMGIKESLEMTLAFFDQHCFSQNDVDQILYTTAATLLNY